MPPNVSGWWTDERVNETVTSRYVHSHLRPNEAEFLTKAVFGDLSDDTYIEWILTKARRFFLALCDAGVPDQIFGIIDDSFGDDDLPIPLEDMPGLRLSPQPDPALDRRFYKAQFKYLIRVVGDGEHIRYAKEETLPIVPLKPNIGGSPKETLEKVFLPSDTNRTYWRRRVSLGSRLSEDEVLAEIADCRRLAHQHVLSIFGSYTTVEDLFVLLTPVATYSLKSFLTDQPKAFEALAKSDRKIVLLNWPHCLASGLAWLHTNGRHHGCIRPSRIQIDDRFQICLGQLSGDGILGTSTVKDDIEAYQYAAPERWKRSVTVQNTGSGRVSLPSGGRTARKLTLDKEPSIGSGTDSSDHSRRLNTMRPTSTSYAFSPISKGNTTRLRLGKMTSNEPRPSQTDRNLETRQTHRTNLSRGTFRFSQDDEIRPMSPSLTSSESSENNGRASRARMMVPTFVAPPELRTAVVQTWQSAQHDQFAADVFSLGAVIMDILTILCKHSYSAFTKHRSSKNRVAGRGGGLADASFHANIGQVTVWAQMLHKDAEKRLRKEDGAVFKAVGPILQLVLQCLERDPRQRQPARDLATKLEEHIRDFGGISQPHCTWDPEDNNGDDTLPERESPQVSRQNTITQRNPSQNEDTGARGLGVRPSDGNHKNHEDEDEDDDEDDQDTVEGQPAPFRPLRLDPEIKIPSQVFEFEFDENSETAVESLSMDGRAAYRARMMEGNMPVTALPYRAVQRPDGSSGTETEKPGSKGSTANPPVTLARKDSGNRSFWIPSNNGRGSYHFPPPPTASPNRSLPPTPTAESVSDFRGSKMSNDASPANHGSGGGDSYRYSRLITDALGSNTNNSSSDDRKHSDGGGEEKQRRSYIKLGPRRHA